MNEVVKIRSYEAKKRMKLGRYEDKREMALRVGMVASQRL